MAELAIEMPAMETHGGLETVELRGFSYADRQQILPAVLRAIERSGSWLREHQQISIMDCEVVFEAQLRTIVEVYSALIGTGMELTRESHQKMTWLCTLRRHGSRHHRRNGTVQLRLELRLLDEAELEAGMTSMGLA